MQTYKIIIEGLVDRVKANVVGGIAGAAGSLVGLGDATKNAAKLNSMLNTYVKNLKSFNQDLEKIGISNSQRGANFQYKIQQDIARYSNPTFKKSLANELGVSIQADAKKPSVPSAPPVRKLVTKPVPSAGSAVVNPSQQSQPQSTVAKPKRFAPQKQVALTNQSVTKV